MADVFCPYCSHSFDIDASDPIYYDEDERIPTECPSCYKKMLVRPVVTYEYEAEEADCLNGSPHDWSEWFRSYPVENFTKWLASRNCYSCYAKESDMLDVTDDVDEQKRLKIYKGIEERGKY